MGRSKLRQGLRDACRTFHSPGARQPEGRELLVADRHELLAPLHFLSGGLFSQDIHRIYESVSQPVWMSHGVRSDFKDFRGKRLVHDRGNWRTTVYPTGALPYFEVPSAFFQAFDAFLGSRTAYRSEERPLTMGPQTAPA